MGLSCGSLGINVMQHKAFGCPIALVILSQDISPMISYVQLKFESYLFYF